MQNNSVRQAGAPRRLMAGVLGAAAMAATMAISASATRADELPGAYVELKNVRLWVSDSGGNGTPVIFLHANTGTIENWRKQRAAFVAAGYRFIAFDRPGWGKSLVREGQKPIPVADDLEELADQLKLDKFHIVAVAGGGYIAMDYAAWKPERIRGLVIAASGLGLGTDKEAVAFRENAAIPGFAKLPPEVREMSPTYRGFNPEEVKVWLEIEHNAKQKDAINPPQRSPNTREKVESIKPPVLVLAGDVDLTTPSGAVRLWARYLKNYEFGLITEAGHSIAWEQPEQFNQRVMEFLKKY